MQEKIGFWKNSSDKDFEVMMSMFQSGHYTWSLFIGHLVIEKLLKALFIKLNGETPPLIHDLRRLANKCDLQLEDATRKILDRITTFNIDARYDNEKTAFYVQCTKEFSEFWINNISEMRTWLIKKL